MKNVNILRDVIWILIFLVLLFVTDSIGAENVNSSDLWTCIDLLDSQTRSDLNGYERFFSGQFQLPNEYEPASEAEKKRIVNQWIKELRGNDYEKSTAAAAYLGIVKATKAAKPLEKRVVTGGGGGRIRWVCTRSLGQIGNKSSIPVLISLLDNGNKNTRIYARVSLAEITNVYFGDDKESWKQYQAGKMPTLCSATECKIDKTDSKGTVIRKSFSRDKLDFCLPEIYGRVVDSQDYANTPVLIMSGSCWCGGCQQDAEPLRKIASEFAPRGLQTIRTIAGDNELAGLDFQKHYRLGFVQLLDTNRSFEKRYNTDGWTFLMLADRDGKIVYKVNSPHEKDWQQLRNILSNMLVGKAANKTIVRDGIAYMPTTLQRTGETETQRICNRFPSIAGGPDGKMYVTFTTNRNGSSDVFLRIFDGSKWSEDLPVASTRADEYDGTVLVDKEGKAWISWTSNTGNEKYDIFIVSFTNLSQLGTPVILTHSEDDAMHPRMACDEKGRIW
ncbi:MAG: redoxin domain-containing protein, partial [Planctomycetota bacterium]